MEHVSLSLTEQEVDIILKALEIAVNNADEYDKDEYEEVLYDVQKKLDEEYDDDVE